MTWCERRSFDLVTANCPTPPPPLVPRQDITRIHALTFGEFERFCIDDLLNESLWNFSLGIKLFPLFWLKSQIGSTSLLFDLCEGDFTWFYADIYMCFGVIGALVSTPSLSFEFITSSR